MAGFFEGLKQGAESSMFDEADYDTQKDLLKERKARAAKMVEASMQPQEKVVNGLVIREDPWAGFARGVAGGVAQSSADAELKALNQTRKQAQTNWRSEYDAATDPAEKRRLLSRADQQGLRHQLEAQFLTADEQRAAAAQEKQLTRESTAAEKEANRAFLASQNDLNRQNKLDTRQIVVDNRQPQRDRFQIVQDADGSQHRVNMDSGEKFPIGLTKPPKAEGNSTESERSAAGYLGRMEAAEKGVGELNDGNPTYLTSAAAAIPGIGEDVRKAVASTEQNMHKQYADDWIRAKLRKESGAVIGADEMKAEYETYFPQRGDSPAIVKQKAQARAQAAEQMRTGAGRVKPTTAAPVQPKDKPTVVREVKLKDGRIGVEYSDGTRGYK